MKKAFRKRVRNAAANAGIDYTFGWTNNGTIYMWFGVEIHLMRGVTKPQMEDMAYAAAASFLGITEQQKGDGS